MRDNNHEDVAGGPAAVPGDFKDSTSITKTLKIFLFLGILVSVIGIWSGWIEYELLKNLREGLPSPGGVAEAIDQRQAFIGIFQIALLILTGILFLKWIYRANSNARALGAEGMKFTPGWSVGWYFIPIANLWKPYQAMKEIWKASHTLSDLADQKGHALLRWWWGFWIISSVIGRLSFQLSMKAEKLDELLIASITTLFSDIMDIPLNIIAILLVSSIHEMQMSHLNRAM